MRDYSPPLALSSPSEPLRARRPRFGVSALSGTLSQEESQAVSGSEAGAFQPSGDSDQALFVLPAGSAAGALQLLS